MPSNNENCWIVHTKVNFVSLTCSAEELLRAPDFWEPVFAILKSEETRFLKGSIQQAQDVAAAAQHSAVKKFRRKDRHVWSTTLILALQDGSSIVFDTGGDRLYIRVDCRAMEMEAYYLGGPIDEFDYVSRRASFLLFQLGSVSQDSGQDRGPAFIFRSDRVGDCLMIASKLRFLAGLHSGLKFDKLIFCRSAMLDLSDLDLADLFDNRAEVAHEKDIHSLTEPETHVVESLSFPLWQDRELLVANLRHIVPLLAGDGPELDDGQFRIVVSLELEKRAWLEQAEALSMVLSGLLSAGWPVTAVFNGMTAPATGRNRELLAGIEAKERELIEQIVSMSNNTLCVENLSGCTLREKAIKMKSARYFVCPVGSASLLPAYLGLPGVFYGAPGFLKSDGWVLEATGLARSFPPEKVSIVEADLALGGHAWSRGTEHGRSYSIEPTTFRDFVLDDISRNASLLRYPAHTARI